MPARPGQVRQAVKRSKHPTAGAACPLLGGSWVGQAPDGEDRSVPVPVRPVPDAVRDLRVLLSRPAVLWSALWASRTTRQSPRRRRSPSIQLRRTSRPCETTGGVPRTTGGRPDSDGSEFTSPDRFVYRAGVVGIGDGRGHGCRDPSPCRCHQRGLACLHGLRAAGSRHRFSDWRQA